MDVFDLFAKLSLDSSEFDSGLSSAVSAAESLGGVLTGGLATAATAGVAAIAAVGTAAIGAGTALVSATADVAAYGDHIDKMSQKIGISSEAYQEWDAILQHCGASVDSLMPSMKTLANAAQNNNEAFQRLGISEKEVANLSQEDLFSRVIEQLQGMEEGTERTYLASQLLGRGATQLQVLFNTSAEETQEMKDRVHELNGVMSDEAVKAAAAYQDQLQDMTTAFDALKRNLMSEFMPSLTTVMGGLTEIFAGNYDVGLEGIWEGVNDTVDTLTDKLPEALDIVTGIFQAISIAILDNASTIVGTLTDVVIDIVEQIAGGAPDIVNIALDVVNTLIDSISSSLPDLIPAITDGLSKALDALTSADTITKLANSAFTLMQSFVAGIINAIPTLLKTLPTLLGNLVSGVFGAIGELMKVSSDRTSNPIIEAYQSLFSEETMNGILESIKGAITMSGDALVELGGVFLDFFTGALNEMSESDETSEGIISLIMSTVDQLFVFLEDYLPEFEQKIIPILEKLWPTIIRLAGKMFEKAAEIVGIIAPYITEIVSGLVKVLVDSGTLQILITGWVDVFKAVVQALPDIIKPLLMSIPSIIVDLSTAFIDCIPDLIECGYEIVAAIVVAIPDIIKALVDEAPNIIDALIEGFTQNDLMQKFVEMVTDVWDAVKGTGESKLEEIWESIENKIHEVYASVLEILWPVLDVILPFLDAVQNLFESLGRLVAVIFALIWQTIKDVLEKVWSKIQEVWQAIIDFISPILDDIKAKVEEIWNGIVDFLSPVIDGLKTTIDEAFQFIYDNAVQPLLDLKDKVEEIFNGIKDFILEFVDGALDWGGDMINNFAQGITEGLDTLTGAIDDVTGTLSANLEHSVPDEGPLSDDDKWMPDMMQSFAKGIRDNTRLVDNAIVDAFDFRGMLGGNGTPGGGGGLITPTASQPVQVTLVLDKQQLGKVVFDLNNQERQRVGVTLGKEAFA